MPPVALFTIGHSTRTIEQFLSLLRREVVVHLADVRTIPASRRYPHFNREPLAASLATAGVEYSHHPALGGRRTPREDSPNAGWRNSGFRGYADHMQTEEFTRALEHLLEMAGRTRVAIMCAEAVPWRCHRSLIADAAVVRGVDVRHILDSSTSPHRLTSFAQVQQGGLLYPPPRNGDERQARLL
jgi:uncharacterized protein (DUF488 family)